MEASVEAGKPYIPALKRPAVKSAGIAAFLSLFVKTKRKPRRAVAEFGRPSWVSPPLHLLRSYCRTSLRARRCTRAFDLGNGADGLPGFGSFGYNARRRRRANTAFATRPEPRAGARSRLALPFPSPF